MTRIIGIDPGLLHTGWAIIDSIGAERHYVASGVILPKTSLSLPERLSIIFRGVTELCEKFCPDVCSIGHARAAAIVAVANKDIPIFEYEPNKIKKALTSAGHADKEQVYKMVKILLPAANPKTSDESDAIAIALAHANMSKFSF